MISKKRTIIDPKHYEAYIDTLEWLEAMSRIPTLRGEKFIPALELQVRKYLDRRGQKDLDKYELLKGLWYHKALVAYVLSDCKPLNISKIEKILKEPIDD